MGLWNLFSALKQRDRKWTARAEHIAADVLDAMWPKMETRLVELKVTEARGYLRARARGVVCQHVASEDARDSVRSKMQSHALDELVRLGVARLLASPSLVSVPMPVTVPAASYRRAA